MKRQKWIGENKSLDNTETGMYTGFQQLNNDLQGGVKFPTGGKAHGPKGRLGETPRPTV